MTSITIIAMIHNTTDHHLREEGEGYERRLDGRGVENERKSGRGRRMRESDGGEGKEDERK